MASQAIDTYDRQQSMYMIMTNVEYCWSVVARLLPGGGYRTAAGMLGLLLYRRKRTNIRYLHGNIIVIYWTLTRQCMISTWWARTRPATRASPRRRAAARRAAPPRQQPGNIASLQLRLCVLCLKEALSLFSVSPRVCRGLCPRSPCPSRSRWRPAGWRWRWRLQELISAEDRGHSTLQASDSPSWCRTMSMS